MLLLKDAMRHIYPLKSSLVVTLFPNEFDSFLDAPLGKVS